MWLPCRVDRRTGTYVIVEERIKVTNTTVAFQKTNFLSVRFVCFIFCNIILRLLKTLPIDTYEHELVGAAARHFFSDLRCRFFLSGCVEKLVLVKFSVSSHKVTRQILPTKANRK